MTKGDMAIYREATAGESMSPSAWTDLSYDTTVREDTDTFNLQVSNEEVDCADVGHYLVMFNDVADLASGLRFTVRERVTVGGVDTAVSGSGYGRYHATNDAYEMYIAGAGIVYADTGGDDINIQVQRVPSTTQTTTRRANVGGLQILKLDDDWDYFRAESDTASAILTLGDEILWENVIEEDTGSFELQANDYDIEVQPGYYLCTYTVVFACTSLGLTGRVGGVSYLLLDGVEVEGSRSMNYGRNSNGCNTGHISCICIFEAPSVQNLKLKTTVSNRTGGGQIADNSTSIQIVKLPDDTLAKCWTYDGTGGLTIAAATLTDINMDDEIDEDTAVFTHSTVSNTDEISVDVDGDYLFMQGMYAQGSDSGDSNLRYTILSRFEDNGTAQQYGNSGCFYRGYANSSSKILSCGMSHGILLPSLTAGDDINIATIKEVSATTYPPTTVADKSAFSAIQLASIFPEDEEDVTGSYWFAQQGF